MQQHFLFGSGTDYRILPTSNTRIESVLLGRSDGVRYFSAYVEEECVEIILTDRGKARVYHRGRSVELAEGQGALFLPGEVRGYGVAKGEEAAFACLRIHGAFGKPVQSMAGPTVFRMETTMTALRLACRMLMEAGRLAGRCARELSANALNMIICMVNEAKSVDATWERGSSQAVLNTIDYIDANYRTGPSVQQIAASCFLSTSRLNSLMKRETGFSPFDYVIERRIGEAQQRLMYGVQSVSDIAREIGYPNLSSFSAAFSKRVGISPEGFRRICGIYGEPAEERQNIAMKL